MLENDKKKQKIRKEKTLGLWEKYDDFIRSLHLQNPFQKPKTSYKKKLLEYLKIALILISASFLTTASFAFFINPNGLYNSGINAIFQIIAQYIISHKGLTWNYFNMLYLPMVFFFNAIMVIILWKVFNSRIEVISTSLLFIIFGITWSFIFSKVNFLFSNLNPSVWITTMGRRDLTITLPYYIIIAFIAAILRAFGLGLISKCQATPDGLDVILTHLCFKKNNLSKKWISRAFNIFSVLFIVMINLKFNEDPVMIESFFKRDWENKACSEQKDYIEFKKELKNNWGMVSSNKLHQKISTTSVESIDNVLLEREKALNESNLLFIDLIKERTLAPRELIEEFLKWEFEFSLSNSEGKIALIDRIITDEIKNSLVGTAEKGVEHDNVTNHLAEKNRKSLIILYDDDSNKRRAELLIRYHQLLVIRRNDLIKQQNESKLKRTLRKIINDERIWATFVYIFTTSHLVGIFFPYDKTMTINIHCDSMEQVERGMNLVKKFCDTYYWSAHFRHEEAESKKFFIIICKLSRWNYYLYLPYLQQLGEIYEN